MTTIKTKIVELPTFEQLTPDEQKTVISNYRDINVDHEDLTSDDSVIDTLEANEYTFNRETLKIDY